MRKLLDSYAQSKMRKNAVRKTKSIKKTNKMKSCNNKYFLSSLKSYS